MIPEVQIHAWVAEIGGDAIDPANFDLEEIDRNPFFCPDPAAAQRWEALMEGVRANDIAAWRDSYVQALKDAGARARAGAAPSPQALEKLRAQELAGPRKLGDAPPVAVPDGRRRGDPGPSDAYDILLP